MDRSALIDFVTSPSRRGGPPRITRNLNAAKTQARSVAPHKPLMLLTSIGEWFDC